MLNPELTHGSSRAGGLPLGLPADSVREALDDRDSAASATRILFARSTLFASLSTDGVAALQRIAVRRSFSGGQIIYLQDDDARYLHLIVAGHVRLSYVMEDGASILHAVLPAGQTFGELGVFDQSVYPDMATASGRVAILSIPTASLLDLARADQALSDTLGRIVANRYRDYIALVRDLSLPSLSARLARTLIRLADQLRASANHEGRTVQLIGTIVTQTDLGLMARGSRGNVNRALQAWQRAGWIALRERSILVLNRSALAAVATDARD